MNKRRRYKAKRRRALLHGAGWKVFRYHRQRTSLLAVRVAGVEGGVRHE